MGSLGPNGLLSRDDEHHQGRKENSGLVSNIEVVQPGRHFLLCQDTLGGRMTGNNRQVEESVRDAKIPHDDGNRFDLYPLDAAIVEECWKMAADPPIPNAFADTIQNRARNGLVFRVDCNETPVPIDGLHRAARLGDANHFHQGVSRVREMLKDPVGPTSVEGIGTTPNPVRLSKAELGTGPHGYRSPSRLGDHSFAGIDTHDPALASEDRSQFPDVVTDAAANV